MAFEFDSLVKQFNSSPLGQAINGSSSVGASDSSAPNTLETDGFSAKTGHDLLWGIKGSDWYKVYGYQFVITSPTTEYYFTLPIPPQVINTKPVFPSNVTPTIGGVHEELSAVTFWKIDLSGTMGIAVSRTQSGNNQSGVDRRGVADQFRTKIATTGLLAGISAGLQSVVGKFGAIANAVEGAAAATSISGLAGSVTGGINNALLPPLPYLSSGVDQNVNGFTETHELQKFFYMYHRLKSDFPKDYNLYFINQKTDQKWQIQIKNYAIKQSASNPNLYRYDINLTGWDVKSTGLGNDRVAYDRFGPEGDLKSVNTVGISAIGKLGKVGTQLSQLGKANIPGLNP